MAGNRLNRLVESSEELPFCFAMLGRDADAGYPILAVNAKLVQLLGCSTEEELRELTGGSFRGMVDVGDYARVVSEVERDLAGPRTGHGHMRYRVIAKSGEKIDVVDTGTVVHDEEAGDVFTLYIARFDEKASMGLYDQLSGLHSRGYLLDVMTSAQAAEKQHPRPGAGHDNVVYVQVERFHDFNEVCGHEEGDLLLRDIGSLLGEVFGTDLMARLYADQFAVLYTGADVLERCRELVRRGSRLREAVPVRLGVGVYRVQRPSVIPMREIDRAKLAYDSAMRAGKGPIGVYTEEVAAGQQLDAHIVESVDEALEKGHIWAAFQPVVRTSTGKVSSFEALARWSDPVYGSISPGRFIPLLEERRLAYKVDEFMVERACDQLCERIDRGLPVVPISVNLSRTDFDRFDPVELVERTVGRYGLDPGLIAIEITETVAMENPDAVRDAIGRFHANGHEVWMDDFGSAYSSLNVLRKFDFDELKIDMAFMSSLDAKTRAIVTSIVNMAKKLGMHTLAEGVETEEQASFLRSIGCNRIQGFLYGRPLSAADTGEWLAVTHAALEARDEAALHDEAGYAVIDPEQAQALLLDDGSRLVPLFASRKVARDLGLDGREATLRRLLVLANGTVSSFGPMLRHAAEASAASGDPKNFYTTIGTGRFDSRVRTIADDGTRRIYLLTFDVVADSTSSDDASRREMLLRSVSDSFDIVYLMDPARRTAEVLFSTMPDECVGSVVSVSDLHSYDLVHPDDRMRFLRCFDTDFTAQMLDETEAGTFSVLIRMRTSSGGYGWREFTFLRIGEGAAGSYLLCGRPFPLVEDDCVEVSRAILASRGEVDLVKSLSPVSGDSSAFVSVEAPFPYVEATVLRDADGTPIDFVYLHVSGSYAHRVNREPEDLVGKRYLAEFPHGSRDWPTQFARAIETGRQVHTLIYGYAAKGWVECYIAPLPGRDRIAVVFVDPDNARELTDQELFSSYQDMPLPCLVVRPRVIDGRDDSEYVYVNDEYCRLVGKDRGELLGHGYRELFSVATTEWVDLVTRAARGERVHERIWGGAQHHWMDVRLAPSSVLGCAVIVGVPVDEEHERISELTVKRTTDVAAIAIARSLVAPESHESVMDSAVYGLGRALGARYLYLYEMKDGAPTMRFAYENTDSAAFGFSKRALRQPERYARWNEALSRGLTVVSANVPLSSEGRFERVELPEGGGWDDICNLLIAPIREGGKLVGLLVAADFDAGKDVDAVELFETVAPFFQARFVENRALERAEYDALTGVRSRAALDAALERIDGAAAGVGVAFADINDLKAANDDGGHAAGDELLKKAAGLLAGTFDAGNVYRVGGDEFVALLVDVDEARFERYRRELEGALAAAGGETLSVGFAWTPRPEEAKSLVKVADERMYAEKDAYHSGQSTVL